MNTTAKKTQNLNIVNKRARFDYHIEKEFEAGLVLQGWECKSIWKNKMDINASYINIRGGELFLFGARITPLTEASTHLDADPMRDRKLLMHRKEINSLIGAVERKGMTLIPLFVENKGKFKLRIALAKGKKDHDKREAVKDREGKLAVERAMKSQNKTYE